MQPKQNKPKATALSAVELQCLRLRYEGGFDNQNIALAIHRSVRTIENHFRNAAAKIGATGGRGKLMLAYKKISAVENT